jgi:hypothetical protein
MTDQLALAEVAEILRSGGEAEPRERSLAWASVPE